MPVIKLSIPGAPAGADLSQYLGLTANQLGDWRFEVNTDLERADAWFVQEDVRSEGEECVVPADKVFFTTAETVWPAGYYAESPSRSAFMQQFAEVLTCHDVYLPTATAAIPFLPWMINANHGAAIFMPHERDLAYLEAASPLPKSRIISVFCSAQNMTPAHRMRFRFVSALKEHFGDRLDWYGNGVNSLPEKWQGLAPYKYTLVLENHAAYNVITEKLLDAFLTDTLPVYYGAPNVGEYFDDRGLVTINAADLKGSIRTIENLLDLDPYESTLPALRENRRRALGELHFLRRMVLLAEAPAALPAANVRIQSISHFRTRREIVVSAVKERGIRLLARASR